MSMTGRLAQKEARDHDSAVKIGCGPVDDMDNGRWAGANDKIPTK